MVVFFTSLAEGHDTRFISARTSRRNWARRSTGPTLGPLSPRVLRAPLPSGPLPKTSRARCGKRRVLVFYIVHDLADFLRHSGPFCRNSLAGVPGFEPGLSVLETDVLTVDTIPLRRKRRAMGRWGDAEKRTVSPRLPVCHSPCLVTSSLYDQCACGNGDKTFETQADPAWSSYSSSSRNFDSCIQCTEAQYYRAA